MEITGLTFEPFMVKESAKEKIEGAIKDLDKLYSLILSDTETCFIKKENREITCLTLNSYPICTFFVDSRFEGKEIIRIRTRL